MPRQTAWHDVQLDGGFMRFIKLAFTAALLPLLASCAPPQSGPQAEATKSSTVDEVIQKAEKGDPDALSFLGYIYSHGEGVPQDYGQAVNWYRKAAEQGSAVAQTTLGTAYVLGNGVRQDDTQAANWFRKAAEQGDAIGQSKLGASYGSGRGVPQDSVLAYAWQNLAAAQGEEDAKSLRDLSADDLSPIQLAEAQRLSSNWQKGQSIQRERNR